MDLLNLFFHFKDYNHANFNSNLKVHPQMIHYNELIIHFRHTYCQIKVFITI